ncbi:hypothetical protein NPIL_355641, partial [Nephila pilipes]
NSFCLKKLNFSRYWDLK